MKARNFSYYLKFWPLLPATIYLFGFFFIIFIYLIGLSLSDPFSEQAFPTLIPLNKVISDSHFKDALINTLLFTIVGTPLELLAGLTLAFLLYKSFFLRGLIRSVFLIPLAVPALVSAMLLFILFDYPGGHINHLLLGNYNWFPQIIDTPINWRGSKEFAMGISLLGKVWRDTPVSMLVLLAGLNSIDTELFDAAKTMGASLRQRLRFITIPLLIPSISAVIMLRSVEMWKEFIFPFVLAGRHHLLGTLIEFYHHELGDPHRASIVALILVACIMLTGYISLKLVDLIRRLLVGYRV